jgi:pSer/pThr/pTyr-binding forkhead associated (FHA) protein
MGATRISSSPAQGGGTVPNHQNFDGSGKNGNTVILGQENDNSYDNSDNLKTMVGFLVSFSRSEAGEYWVLREGNNFIGTNSESSIKLNEKTVSEKHATLNITRNAKENKYDIVLVDTTSTNGTFLNGDKILAYSGKVVSNNDKLSIGNYELKLIIIERFSLQLDENSTYQTIYLVFDNFR